MSETVLSFRAVTKEFPRPGARPRVVLRDVDLDVDPGQTLSIMGRSGSGKSTLLNLAAGLDLPSRGTVHVLGLDVTALSDARRARLRREQVGFVFQFFHLLSHLDVIENAALPALIAGERRATWMPRARELLSRVGLEDRAGERIEVLSGGEMQRVAICRALLRRPRIILADEPTGNLDDENGRRVMDLLLGLVREQRTTLVYVTHDPELAALADRTAFLHSGILEAR